MPDTQSLRVEYANLNGTYFPITIYRHPFMPTGYLCMEYREILPLFDSRSMCIKQREGAEHLPIVPKVPTGFKPRAYLKMPEKETEEGEETDAEWVERISEQFYRSGRGLYGFGAEDERRMPVVRMHAESPGAPLHGYLLTPNNVGVLCRVRDASDFKFSRIFAKAYYMLNPFRRVKFCPKWWLQEAGIVTPEYDPLVTFGYTWRPWMWEGCIPFILRAISDPSSVGLYGVAPLMGIAVPEGHKVTGGLSFSSRDQTLPVEQFTIKLIEESFKREAAGGFDFNGTWVPYKDIISIRSPTLREAGELLHIFAEKPAMMDVKWIYNNYEELVVANNPDDVDPNMDSETHAVRSEYVEQLNGAFLRIMLERLIAGKSLYPYSHDPAKREFERQQERIVADRVMRMLINVDDSKISEGIVRLVWRKEAPKQYGLKAKTLSYYADASGEWEQGAVATRILDWFQYLYVDYYRSQGYNPQIDIEGLKLEE